ncbi:MAG: hypothetical protein V2I33_26380 [Kangiellaceae bacterium]|jgi:hypothetical protein|nr:hypothetical protein [Kangiellaceae bacterium]
MDKTKPYAIEIGTLDSYDPKQNGWKAPTGAGPNGNHSFLFTLKFYIEFDSADVTKYDEMA